MTNFSDRPTSPLRRPLDSALWTNDQILKYDPGSSKWTIFELPVRGTEIRHISLDERNGVTQVILPVYRTNQMGVMTLRSDADLAALKAQAAR